MCDEQKRYWIWLSSINGIGPVGFYKLLSYYEDAKSVWLAAKKKEKMSHIIGKKQDLLYQQTDQSQIDKIIEKCHKLNIDTVTRLDDQYPCILAELNNPPPTLYVKGDLGKLTQKAIGIVGTRNCSTQCADFIKNLSYELAKNDVCVVSGMARGIDSAAHQGTLKAGGRTFAVLGCGADVVYPAENIDIYKKMIDCGAIITEYLPGIKPLASNFPARNRIISGLVKGILVAESSFKGGANITVKCAIDQGREVMAVPCSPYDIRAELPNDIIKNGGLIVQDAGDILSEFGWVYSNKHDEKNNKINIKLDFFEKQIYNLLLQGDLTIDQLLEVVEFQQSDLFITLTMLEMKQVVFKKPGNIYSIKCFISER